jgi:hypothetical protein
VLSITPSSLQSSPTLLTSQLALRGGLCIHCVCSPITTSTDITAATTTVHAVTTTAAAVYAVTTTTAANTTVHTTAVVTHRVLSRAGRGRGVDARSLAPTHTSTRLQQHAHTHKQARGQRSTHARWSDMHGRRVVTCASPTARATSRAFSMSAAVRAGYT